MRTITVKVEQIVELKLDESKFTPEFLQEFKDNFYQFNYIEDHARHLSQMAARGLYGDINSNFVEGYGELKDMGISINVVDQSEEII